MISLSSVGASAKAGVKRLRTWPPLNRVVTSAAYALTKTTGFLPAFVPRHLHRIGLVSQQLPSGAKLRLWSRGDDWVSNQLFWFGWTGYEPETLPVYCALAERARVTVDVGSYVGFYALLAAHANPQAIVYAFEPLPPIVRRLQRNIALNGVSNIVVMQAAVSAAGGSQEFFYSGLTELPTSSSLSYEFMATVPQLQGMSVQVVALDDLFQDGGDFHVDLLKIDTESTEPAVLRGAQMLLARDTPDIICEVLPGANTGPDLEAILGPLGYRYFHLSARGPRQVTGICADDWEHLNYLCTTMEWHVLQQTLSDSQFSAMGGPLHVFGIS